MDNSPLVNKLAPELRNEIFELVTISPAPLDLEFTSSTRPYSRSTKAFISTALSLMRTCKQARQECHKTFWTRNRWTIVTALINGYDTTDIEDDQARRDVLRNSKAIGDWLLLVGENAKNMRLEYVCAGIWETWNNKSQNENSSLVVWIIQHVEQLFGGVGHQQPVALLVRWSSELAGPKAMTMIKHCRSYDKELRDANLFCYARLTSIDFILEEKWKYLTRGASELAMAFWNISTLGLALGTTDKVVFFDAKKAIGLKRQWEAEVEDGGADEEGGFVDEGEENEGAGE